MKKYFLLIAVLVAVLGVGAVKAEYSADEIAEFRARAKQGDTDAQWNLGEAYFYGKGVDENPNQALEWLRKAAEQGHACAQVDLGFMYFVGWGVDQDQKKAVEWYRKSAEQGNKRGQYRLGLAYSDGHGVEHDQRKGFDLLHKSAEQGSVAAQRMLGSKYYVGYFQDMRKAVKWHRKAAEQGDSFSQHQLAVAYLVGEGVIRDYREAYIWELISKASGSTSAKPSAVESELSASEIRSAQKEAAVRFEEIESRVAESE